MPKHKRPHKGKGLFDFLKSIARMTPFGMLTGME